MPPCSTTAPLGALKVDRRRRPDATVLYRVVAEHLETLLAEARDRSAHGGGYPRFIEDTFRRYLTCGILAFGFGRVRCETCGDEDLVAFSCKGRGLCPSCQARRMAATAATLVDEVLPVARYRQWTLSVPWRLRLLLATRPALVSWVLGVFVRKVFAGQRRAWRDLIRAEGGAPSPGDDDAADEPRRRARPEPGAITSLQRFGSKINLHCHYHSLVPDAVWVRTADGSYRTVTLPAPDDDDVRAIATAIARRVLTRLDRADAAAGGGDDDDDGDHDQVLAQTALLASASLVPTAPTTRVPKTRPRCAWVDGFSLDADVTAEPRDRRALERLLRYGARPAFAHDRLELTAAGKVSYRLRRPWHTGQTHVVLPPVDFLRRIAALIPPPRQHLVRYHGCFAPGAKARPGVLALVPRPAPDGNPDRAATADHTRPPSDPDPERSAPGRRAARQSWPRLLSRVFARDVLVCDLCAGPRRIIAWITDRAVIVPILRHLGLPTSAPRIASARAPPQADLFDDLGAPGADDLDLL